MSFENLNFESKYKYTYEESYNEDKKITKIVYSFENYELIIYKQNRNKSYNIAFKIKHKNDKITYIYKNNSVNSFENYFNLYRIIQEKEIPFKEIEPNPIIIYYSNDFICEDNYCIPLKEEKYNELIKEETYKNYLTFNIFSDNLNNIPSNIINFITYELHFNLIIKLYYLTFPLTAFYNLPYELVENKSSEGSLCARYSYTNDKAHLIIEQSDSIYHLCKYVLSLTNYNGVKDIKMTYLKLNNLEYINPYNLTMVDSISNKCIIAQ